MSANNPPSSKPINATSNTGTSIANIQLVFKNSGDQLTHFEKKITLTITKALNEAPNKADRKVCDQAFSYFTFNILMPYSQQMMTSRAAVYARYTLIPEVLGLENNLNIQFHKAQLFYDTAIAHLLSGDTNRFEYFLAMADEEEVRTGKIEGAPRARGVAEMKEADLNREIFRFRFEFMANLCNGTVTDSPITFDFLFDSGLMRLARLDKWRRSLDSIHHFELFRVLSEIETFCGMRMPTYPIVRDNPYIMLRLCKALANAAEWVENDLTRLQDNSIPGSLSDKLLKDPDLQKLVAASGSPPALVGPIPHGAALGVELEKLIDEIERQSPGIQRHWRVVRIVYLLRNSTAYVVDPTIPFHADRALLIELLQVIMLSVFVVRQHKVPVDAK